MPPKNKISVARKSHIPNVDASFCCSASPNWWRSASEWLANRHLLDNRIVVSFVCHDRGDVEIFGWRRRGRLPFETWSAPRISRGDGAVAKRPDEINRGYQVPDREHRSARRR